MAVPGPMERFIQTKYADWQRLETLLERQQSLRLRGLSAVEIEELGRLYRQATSDLAVARRDFPGQKVTLYLNQLVASAHPSIYRSEVFELRRFTNFLFSGFPRLFRQTFWFTFAAFAIFAIGAIIMFAATMLDPQIADTIVSRQFIQQIQHRDFWVKIPPEERFGEAALIMSNNIGVAFRAFAGGILLGLYTVYVLFVNGAMIGTVAALCQQNGLAGQLWTFVAPHGGIELTVIFMAGGSGLQLGYAILHPGLLSRRDALAETGRRIIGLVIGGALLLVIAGLFEGLVSPSELPAAVKIATGIFNLIWLYGYLFFAGRPLRKQHSRVALAELQPAA